ncbi:ArsR/SmtB family transcription factor [Nocardia veterana]|uniref:Winged helix-turn-helix transcriptional regulator n=1 Tax=Nocardia veterana TaxID=132249 RepID=A0A7X6RIK5_9NOCA|nr:metalloregulator ArsR/SmtB family transcription factor [Nocardia veterana]NKY86674.1 winged helix-turn-helix transcriptional regulator [Nocardia veterana]
MVRRLEAGPADQVFTALANPTRREILDLLLDGEQTVQAIAERFDMTRPSVSEHLKVLRDSGLVAEDKRGRYRYYRIEPEPLHELQFWLSPFERFWRQRLRALGDLVATLDDNENPANETESDR